MQEKLYSVTYCCLLDNRSQTYALCPKFVQVIFINAKEISSP